MKYFVLYDNGSKKRVSRVSAKHTLSLSRVNNLFEKGRAEAKKTGKATMCIPGLTQTILFIA